MQILKLAGGYLNYRETLPTVRRVAQPKPASGKRFDEWSQDDLATAWAAMRYREGFRSPGINSAATIARERGTEKIPLAPIYTAALKTLRRRGTLPSTRIAQALNAAPETLRRAMCRMQARGCVQNTSGGRGNPALWVITDAGREALNTGFLPPVANAKPQGGAE